MKKLVYILLFLPLFAIGQANIHTNGVQDGDETGVDCGGSSPYPCHNGAAVTAFDGAYGPGRYATGGRNGDVYVVTQFSDETAPGSYTYGVQNAPAGGRIIVFQIGGRVDRLETSLTLSNDNITVLGHSAPSNSGGVRISNGTDDWRGDNFIRRYLTYEHGDFGYRDASGTIIDATACCNGNDAFGIIDSDIGIVDHVSVRWSIDENLSVAGLGTAVGPRDITIQYSIVAEPLANSISDNGRHPYGSLINLTDTTWVIGYGMNYYALNESRNPRLSRTFAEMMYNVYYGSLDALVSDPGATFTAIKNTWKESNSLSFLNDFALSETNNTGWGGGPSGGYGKLYFEENFIVGYGVGLIDATYTSDIVATKEDTGVYTSWPDWTRTQAIDSVLAKAGNRWPQLDAHDQRYIGYYSSGEGVVIDTQEQVGGFLSVAAGTPWPDTDSDGMDDNLEISYFGDLSQDALTIASNGRTNIENLYNSRVDGQSVQSYGYTVTPTSGLTTTEAGGTDTFTVVLNELPASNVVFDITSNDTGEGTVSASTLTFTTGNWSTPQTITVTGVDDGISDGNVAYTVTVSVNDASSDDNYDPLADTTVNLNNTDNDSGSGAVIRARGGKIKVNGKLMRIKTN